MTIVREREDRRKIVGDGKEHTSKGKTERGLKFLQLEYLMVWWW